MPPSCRSLSYEGSGSFWYDETKMKRRSLLPGFLVLLAVIAGLWLAPLPFKGNAQAQRHLADGVRHAERGDLDAAAADWEKTVALDARNSEAWSLLGEYYSGKSDFENAIRCLTKLVEVAPETPESHGRLAIAFLSVRSELAAFEEAEKELKRAPEHIPSLAVIASLAGAGGMGDKQLAALEKLVRLLPEDRDFLERYCQMLLERKRDTDARPFVERFRKLAPDSHLAATFEGILASRADTTSAGTQKAIALFEEALRREPGALFPRLYLGKLYLRARQPEKALGFLEVAAAKMPQKMDIQFELANAYSQAKQPEKAAQARQRFEKIRTDNDKMHSLMKRCAVDLKNAALFKETGLFSLKVGNLLNARVYLDQAEKLKPGDPEVKAGWEKLNQQEEKRQDLIEKLGKMRQAQKEAGR